MGLLAAAPFTGIPGKASDSRPVGLSPVKVSQSGFPRAYNEERLQISHGKPAWHPGTQDFTSCSYAALECLLRDLSLAPPGFKGFKPRINPVLNWSKPRTMQRIKEAAAAIYGWDFPLLTFIYPGFDCDSYGNQMMPLSQ